MIRGYDNVHGQSVGGAYRWTRFSVEHGRSKPSAMCNQGTASQ